MSLRMNRRQLIMGGVGLGALAAFGGSAAFAAQSRVRLLWWGSQSRTERTDKVIGMFNAANPDTTVEGESAGWDSYWPRLATQTAGGNAPDLIQMDYRYIFEYARRGALLPLDSMIGNTIDLSGFTPEAIASGQVDGKTYGVSLGANSSAMIVKASSFTDAGVAVPERGITWDDFADRCAQLTKAAKKRGFYGTQDAGGLEPTFEGWLRQRGKALYNAEGKLGFAAEDAADWYAMWAAMRDSGACVPADVQALDQLNIETSMTTLGHAAISFGHSNQIVGYQALSDAPLTMLPYPTGGPGSKPGQYRKPSMFFSAFSKTANADGAGKFLNFFINNPDAAKVLGVERGVPESASIRALLAAELDAASKVQIEYIDSLAELVGPLPPPPPKGAGEIQFVLKRINEEIGFGSTSAKDGGATLVTEAEQILARA